MLSPKSERVIAALQGGPVDRVPISLWGHDYLREWSAEGLAEAMLEFHRRWDWDYMKVNPRATYYSEAWGCRYEASGRKHEGPRLMEHVVKKSNDWTRLGVLDPYLGPFGEQVKGLRLIGEGLQGDAPFVQTVFSPLSVAGRLTGEQERDIKAYIKEAPQALHRGLAAIAETVAAYARACLEAGASGIFFATTIWGSRDLLDDEQYEEFGRLYDMQVLEAVQKGASFNILHVCGSNNRFDQLQDYPVHAISWAATLPTNISLKEGLARTNKAVIGGISEKTTLKDGMPEAVAEEVSLALEQTGGRRILLAPGCSIPTKTPDENIRAAKRARDAWRSQ